MQKITSHLWFDKEAREANEEVRYCRIEEGLRRDAAGIISGFNMEIFGGALLPRSARITTLLRQAKHTEAEILELQGMGPSSLPKYRPHCGRRV